MSGCKRCCAVNRSKCLYSGSSASTAFSFNSEEVTDCLSWPSFFIWKTVIEGLGCSSVVEYCLTHARSWVQLLKKLSVGSSQGLIKFSTQNTLKIASYRVKRDASLFSTLPLLHYLKKHLLNTNYTLDSALSIELTGLRQQTTFPFL